MTRTIACLILVPMLSTFAMATQAQSKMFKCVSGGRTVYQQTACPVAAQADEAKASAPAASSPRAETARASTRPERTSAPNATAGSSSPSKR